MDSACLSDSDLLALSEGRLGAEQHAPLHRHLARCSACMLLVTAVADTELADAAAPTLRDLPESEPEPESDLLLGGHVVCGYKIGRELGRGSMGVVYAAVHPDIGQRAAVKVLFREFSANPQFIQRFRTEARATSAVQHPGLLTIFNHGQLADGTAYILMEYLEGQSLRAKLAEHAAAGQRPQVADVLRIARQIASAMDAVHRHGIVHRDLKPSNVMLVADPDVAAGERAKVVDFGLARINATALHDYRSSAPTIYSTDSAAGLFVGTAAYAAPEQCRMERPGDGRSDVYSLGVMLYEMLAGTLPFVGSPIQLLQQHLEATPRPLQQAAPGLPMALCNLVHKMLAKLPEQRPPMAQVRDQLQGLQAADERRRSRRRLRPTIWLLAVLLLALTGLAFGCWYKLHKIRAEKVLTVHFAASALK